MPPQKRAPRSTRWSHLEDRLYEHVQEAMGMVLSTGDELQLEVDRLRKERDLAREEAIQARTERDTATLRAREEAAERVALEKDLDVLREELAASQHDIGRFKGFLCVAEDDKQAECKARRRAEEDLNQLQSRYEKLVDELRTGLVSAGRPRATQRDFGELRRSDSELDSAGRSSYSVSYYPPSSHRTQPSRYTTGPVSGPSNISSNWWYPRPISPPPKNTPWAPPSPRKTTSQSSPQDTSRVNLDRVSPAKPQSPRPTYTHLRTTAKVTAIVPIHHIKEEEEEMSLPPGTPARPLQDNKLSPLRRRRSMARLIQEEDEAEYVGATEEGVGVLDESEEDEIAIGHASDDGTYGVRPVKQTATRKRKALTMLGSSRRKVKR